MFGFLISAEVQLQQNAVKWCNNTVLSEFLLIIRKCDYT